MRNQHQPAFDRETAHRMCGTGKREDQFAAPDHLGRKRRRNVCAITSPDIGPCDRGAGVAHCFLVSMTVPCLHI